MTKRYLGNIITQNPTAPAGNFEGSAAKGVWSLEEQLAYQKAGLWPVPGNAPVDITDVFSTYLYDGNGSTQTITNSIDLSGEGGLVWIKARNSGQEHNLFDTERGVYKFLQSQSSVAEDSNSGKGLTAFNSNGFSLDVGNESGSSFNNSSYDYASWTFRKAPKFFTCLTYTGTGSAQNISHNLGSVPGMIIVKRTDDTSDWAVYHRQLNGGTNRGHWRIKLNSTGAQADQDTFWNDTAPSDSVFTVGTSTSVNASGGTYVAYLFAHNDGDGQFGPDGDQDIIKCGSYTATGSDVDVDLGWEPQFIITRNVSRATEWNLQDTMRGMTDNSWTRVIPNDSSADFSVTSAFIFPTSTGFKVTSVGNEFGNAGDTVIYMAIRRGPLAAPTAGTEVFAPVISYGVQSPGFPVDFLIGLNDRTSTQSYDPFVKTRLLGGVSYLTTSSTAVEASGTDVGFDTMNGLTYSWPNSNPVAWYWRRAPGYFDAVAYSGTSSATTISHNLTVAPDMMWVKSRANANRWTVFHKDQGPTKRAFLDVTQGFDTGSVWNNTAPTSTVFSVGTDSNTNSSGHTFIAYLFSTLAGVSKVGSYTGTGNSGGDINVDCGFTSGARFVLIKRTDASGGWWVADTARGIVTGNESLLALDDSGAEVTGFNMVKPYSAGFIVNGSGGGDNAWNDSGGNYIFYAIA